MHSESAKEDLYCNFSLNNTPMSQYNILFDTGDVAKYTAMYTDIAICIVIVFRHRNNILQLHHQCMTNKHAVQ